MKYKFREKTPNGFFCMKYGCSFGDPEFCKKRAQGNIDKICQTCTGIEGETKKGKSSSLEFSTKGMNRRKAA
jgi:hypothetical protein